MDRQIALEILLKYKQDNSYLNLTLNSYLQNDDLTRDKKILLHVLYMELFKILFFRIYFETTSSRKS